MSCKNIKSGDIPIIANSFKCGTTRAVKTLNSILGFTEFDRSSRNKVRNFSTFPQEFRVEEHKEKILTEFSLPDFISVANLFHFDVETNEQNLYNSIFKALTNLDEFQLTLNNSETSFSESENVVSKTNHIRQEFFIGRDRPALPFSTSGQQRTLTQRTRLFFHAGRSKRFFSLYTKYFSSLFKRCFPYRDEYPVLDFITGYFGN
ncbi:uncharacterized protein LOC105457711 [Trichonephila clavipes]|uniref:Uncharacterized protein LOC105457711 n=1 Tax=Trichonephila clavipes TaxID=2585209 RepID=A0A8X6V242_TRICX|nr:uncharacterized protein LOC105457711 [Trichonephila clavipes]